MSEPDGFLTRWSRRKREAAEPKTRVTTDAKPPEAAEPSDARATESDETAERQGGALSSSSEASADSVFDISNLPPIESITAATDVRAFLQPGVPVDIARAALRRAWSADPAIRDYIGLSENAWDFNAPDSVPGFSSHVSSDDVARILGDVFGDRTATEPETADLSPASDADGDQSVADKSLSLRDEAGPDAALEGTPSAPPDDVAKERATPQEKTDAATQNCAPTVEIAPAPTRSRRGGALPV